MRNEMISLSERAAPICFITAAAMLSAGSANLYTGAGWILVSTALLLWWYLRKPGWNLLPSVLLVLNICAAAGGILLGKEPAWMIFGTAAALAGWELTGQPGSRYGANNRNLNAVFQRKHLQLLMTAIVMGLGIAEIGLFLHIVLPFWAIFLAGMLILFSLYGLYRTLILYGQ
jgi:hypothetical protein